MLGETEQGALKSVYQQEQPNITRFETVLFPENADVLRKDMADNGWTIIPVSNPGVVIAERE